MSNPILPTVGRVVHYCPPTVDEQPREAMAAIVAAVHSDDVVTLTVCDLNGGTFPAQRVPYVEAMVGAPDQFGTPEELGAPFWRWMPYQIGQAAKTEQTAADLVAAEVARQLDDVATPGGES